MNNNVNNLPNPINPRIIKKIGNNKERYYLSIQLRAIIDNLQIMLIVLCNPASANGTNNGNFDSTIRWIINNIDLSLYYKIIIVNVIPLIGSKLNTIYSDNNEYLDSIKDTNKRRISNVLRNNNIARILFACGQHFTHSNGLPNGLSNDLSNDLSNNLYNIMKDFYKRCFIEIYEILNNYRNILFCLGFTDIRFERNRLPSFPTNRSLKKFTSVNTDDGLKYALVKY